MLTAIAITAAGFIAVVAYVALVLDPKSEHEEGIFKDVE
jgi:hypothetical protein